MRQHLKHGATGFNHLVGRQAFAQQIVAGNRAVSQVDVCRVVNDSAVDFFGHPHVKTAVASLHVEYGYLAPLGRNNAQATVGVAQHQHGLRLLLQQHRVHFGNDVANGFGGAAHGSVQKMVGLAQAQVVKKNLVQLVVVVLACVHQYVVAMLVKPHQHARQADDFGPCAHHRHDFEFFHCLSLYSKQVNVSGRWRSKISLAHSMTTISSCPVLVMSCVQPGTVSTTSALAPLVHSS